MHSSIILIQSPCSDGFDATSHYYIATTTTTITTICLALLRNEMRTRHLRSKCRGLIIVKECATERIEGLECGGVGGLVVAFY